MSVAKNFRFRCGLSVFLIFFAGTSAKAARPFTIDDAGTVEVGKFELETACDYWKNSAVASVGLTHGITKRMDLGIGIGYVPVPSDEKAFTDASIGLKFALIPELFSVTFGSTFDDPEYDINAIVSRSFGAVNVDLNLGYQAQGSTNDADLLYGVAIVYDYKRLGAGAEFRGSQENPDWWQIGARFVITDFILIDAGIGGDFNQDPSLTATTGLWFGFPNTDK
jgi:hypothetical protein